KLREKVNAFNQKSPVIPAIVTLAFIILPEIAQSASPATGTTDEPELPRPQFAAGEEHRANLSTAGLRALARVRREVPVDLRLNSEELRRAADVAALIEACAASGASALRGPGGPGGPGGQGQSPKTLALGPWGQEPGSDAEAPEAAIQAFIRSSPTWTCWALRSISIVEIRGVADCAALLGAALRPCAARILRLQHLALRGAITPLLEAFCKDQPRQLEILDLSGNGFTDEDVASLLSLTTPKEGQSRAALELEGLVLSANPSMSYATWQSLVASPLRESLRLLDLSECGVGPAGAQLLAQLLETSPLRDLSLYRCGIDQAGVLRLITAAVSLRSLDLTANAHHLDGWMEAVGQPVARALLGAPLKVLTLSCSEKVMQAAAELFVGLPTQVILVPNEQNNYNRLLFLGED
ncbi:unnamed protein product, partial [Symbiodinium necroappetens]